MLKQTTSLRNAAIAAASLSLPMMSVALAQQGAVGGTSAGKQCKITLKRVLFCSLAASAVLAMAVSNADAASRKRHPKGHHYSKTWTYHHRGYQHQWGYGREWTDHDRYANSHVNGWVTENYQPTMVGDVPYQFSSLNWGGAGGL
jgi:hypothetical protein